ncbi:MAG: ATP-dependent helicase, partial [Candidatus Omnitrophica bacterium]|nr:ATP-dependent helicase [Candidatus Omnitrophota bacterium]
IKDVISYLRIIHNRLDQVSWYRALLLLKGVGPKTAERIIAEVVLNKKSSAVDPKFINKIDGLKPLLELLEETDTEKHKPAEIIHVFLKYYQPLLKEKYDDFNKRLNDLDSLERIASRYSTLEQFLSDMALEPPERNLIEPGIKDRDDSLLTLSTIHSAKGLEWHTVFVIYVAEGHLPSYLSLEDKDATEEERRLFYVALTRAKENLFLLKPHIDRSPRSYFDGGGGSVFTTVSRFLEEGNILTKFLDSESAETDDFDDIRVEDIIRQRPNPDKAFLDMMKEYFRD